MKYRCSTCGSVAEIDKDKKTITVEVKGGTIPAPTKGRVRNVSAFTFPSHFDCEFNKPVDKIDLELLEKVDDHTFRHERGITV